MTAFASLILIGSFADKTPNQSTAGGVNSTSSNPKHELSQTQKDSIAKAEKMKQIEERKRATVKASDLVGLYVQNEVNADNQMKGKEFYVEGKIEGIGKDIMDNIYVTLESRDVIRNVQWDGKRITYQNSSANHA